MMDDLTIRRLEKEGRRFCEHDDGIWFPYLFVYTFKDKRYGIEMWARSMEEAEEVCKSVKDNLSLGGEILD